MAIQVAQDFQTARRCGKFIRILRDFKGMSRSDLARQVGFTPQQVSNVELGKINTPIETLARFAAALDVHLDEIVVGPARPGNAVTDYMVQFKDLEVSIRKTIASNLRKLADQVENPL